MVEYRPGIGPAEFDQLIAEAGKDSIVARFAEWAREEFLAIARAQKEQTSFSMQILYEEPSHPTEGMIAWADGSTWNPGAGEGLYIYINGGWRRVGFHGDYVNRTGGSSQMDPDISIVWPYNNVSAIILATESGFPNATPTPVPGQARHDTAVWAGVGGSVSLGGSCYGDCDLWMQKLINPFWRSRLLQFHGMSIDATHPSKETVFTSSGGGSLSTGTVAPTSRGGSLRLVTEAVAGSACLVTCPYDATVIYNAANGGYLQFWKFWFAPFQIGNQRIECGLTVFDQNSTHKIFWRRDDTATEGAWVESATVAGTLTTVGSGVLTATGRIQMGMQQLDSSDNCDMQFMMGDIGTSPGTPNAMLYRGLIASANAYQNAVELIPYVYIETTDAVAKTLEINWIGMSVSA